MRSIDILDGVGKSLEALVMGSQKLHRDGETQGEVERRRVDSVLQGQAVK